MDFYVNSVTDVFAWVLVVAGAMAVAGVVGVVIATMLWLQGTSSGWVVLAGIAVALTAAVVALLGLAGDYLQRIYRQSSGRPFYLIRRVYETPLVAEESRVR